MRQYTASTVSPATPPANRAVRRAPHALGTPGTFPSGQVARAAQAVTTRWRLQSRGAKLLPDEAVSSCMRCMQQGVSLVSVIYVAATSSAHYSGLQTCGSVWLCCVCAAKITQRRKGEIEQAVMYAAAHDLQVVMFTYTFQHSRVDSLRGLVERMSAAAEFYRSGRPYTRLRKAFGVVGYIRALEVTYGRANGWHPHVHELVFLAQGVDLVAFSEASRQLWEHAAARSGLSMNKHGFKADTTDTRIAAYIAKFGRDPSEVTVQRYTPGTEEWQGAWNEAAELTKWHIKQGVARLGDDEHVTPFGLLAYADEGDVQAAALFQEYAGVFKGRHQLQWSRGLKQLVGIEEKSDKELAEEECEQGNELIALSRPAWAVVVANDARCELLQVARLGDVERVTQFLYDLGIDCRDMP